MITELKQETKTRIGLINTAIQLLKGIDESFLLREGRPVIILVDGDTDSGKKIIPDTAVSYVRKLLEKSSEQAVQSYFEGKAGYDEYTVFPLSDDRSLLVSFINVAYGVDYSDIIEDLNMSDISKVWHNKSENPWARTFLDFVKHSGGLAFVHNCMKTKIDDYDFKLYIESPTKNPILKNDWVRRITVTGNSDSDVFTSQKFQQQLLQLQHMQM